MYVARHLGKTSDQLVTEPTGTVDTNGWYIVTDSAQLQVVLQGWK